MSDANPAFIHLVQFNGDARTVAGEKLTGPHTRHALPGCVVLHADNHWVGVCETAVSQHRGTRGGPP